MPLDLSQLQSLLLLPCVINSDKVLTETPIFTAAECFRENVYFLTVEKGESLSDYLHRVYGGNTPYEMDCSVYAQLSAAVLSGGWPIDGGKIAIYIGAEFGDFMLWNFKIDEMGYIGVSDVKVAGDLAKMATTSKGQWCIRISQDEYLGLGGDGPLVFSMGSWVERLRSGLIKYAGNLDNNPITTSMLTFHIYSGKLNTWKFFTKKENYEDTIVSPTFSCPETIQSSGSRTRNYKRGLRTISRGGMRIILPHDFRIE